MHCRVELGMHVDPSDVEFRVWVEFGVVVHIPFAQADTEGKRVVAGEIRN